MLKRQVGQVRVKETNEEGEGKKKTKGMTKESMTKEDKMETYVYEKEKMQNTNQQSCDEEHFIQNDVDET